MASPSGFGEISEENISRDLTLLNGKLQGAGIDMADCLRREFEVWNATNERDDAVQKVSNRIGSVFGESLQRDIPKLLPIAFQACLASALYRVASANLNNDTDQNSSREGE